MVDPDVAATCRALGKSQTCNTPDDPFTSEHAWNGWFVPNFQFGTPFSSAVVHNGAIVEGKFGNDEVSIR
jgi:hypothetical protein